MVDQTDRKLVLQLQKGSLDALGVLYERHQSLVFRTAMMISADPEAAADLVQEVFLRLYRFADKVDPTRPLEPWLYRVTTNTTYTWITRQKKRFQHIIKIAEWMRGESHPSTDINLERSEQWEQIAKALSSLPLQQRTVIALYYINNLSLIEISDILEIPIGTIKSRLFYGRRTLKRQLSLHDDLSSKVQYEFT